MDDKWTTSGIKSKMCALKPNKPNNFDGKRDEYAVQTWLYQVKQYLTLTQIGNALILDEPTKISFAATFFSDTAAAWWYTLVASNSIPDTWEAFENAVRLEFIPFDSVQRSRDKLRRLIQRTSVSSYLSEFRNIVLTIPGMNASEQVDRFCQGLKPQIRLEVMKAGARTMNDASRIALNVDAALFGSGMLNYQWSNRVSVPTPMEIGNVEQKDKDRRSNACFKCHKVGCRPWKCGKERHSRQGIHNKKSSVSMSNVDVNGNDSINE